MHTQGPPWIDNAHTRHSYDRDWIIVVGLMLIYGAVLFGYRALLFVGLTTVVTLLVYRVTAKLLSMVKKHSPHISLSYALWSGMLLGLALPMMRDWTVPMIAGATLGVLLHLIGRSFRLRIHPVALTLVLIWLVPAGVTRTDPLSMRNAFAQPIPAVLTPSHLFVGNVNNYDHAGSPDLRDWLATSNREWDATHRENPQLQISVNQRQILEQPRLFVNMLASGELPQIPDVIFGVVPGAIGATSPALLIFLGLMLIYKRLASWRTALSALVAMVCVYLVLPMRLGVGDDVHISFVMTQLSQMEITAAITFIAYVVLASPWFLIVMIFGPGVDPMSRPGRITYGLLLGGMVAMCVWFSATPEAAYLALVIAGILSRPLDNLHRSPFVHR
ncbi:RnfABCDGE type electron transport complex subunit D [Planctomycetota bacterium]|nr:RnfABCDGE type electron transport complex subunit D [Planctomycetota bacterium]